MRSHTPFFFRSWIEGIAVSEVAVTGFTVEIAEVASHLATVACKISEKGAPVVAVVAFLEGWVVVLVRGKPNAL